MRTKRTYEAGDRVVAKSTAGYGVCSTNDKGGTEAMPVGKAFLCTVVKTWDDYEIGRRYVAETADGRKLFFGESDVEVRLA